MIGKILIFLHLSTFWNIRKLKNRFLKKLCKNLAATTGMPVSATGNPVVATGISVAATVFFFSAGT